MNHTINPGDALPAVKRYLITVPAASGVTIEEVTE